MTTHEFVPDTTSPATHSAISDVAGLLARSGLAIVIFWIGAPG